MEAIDRMMRMTRTEEMIIASILGQIDAEIRNLRKQPGVQPFEIENAEESFYASAEAAAMEMADIYRSIWNRSFTDEELDAMGEAAFNLSMRFPGLREKELAASRLLAQRLSERARKLEEEGPDGGEWESAAG